MSESSAIPRISSFSIGPTLRRILDAQDLQPVRPLNQVETEAEEQEPITSQTHRNEGTIFSSLPA